MKKTYLLSVVSVLILISITTLSFGQKQTSKTVPPLKPGGSSCDYVTITAMIDIPYNSWSYIGVSVYPISDGKTTAKRVNNGVIKISVTDASNGTFNYEIRVRLLVDGLPREFRSFETFNYCKTAIPVDPPDPKI